MLQLITGGSASGKSAYAESRVLSLGADRNRIYIATMKPWDEETQKRIRRHQDMRAGKGFATIECDIGLEQVLLAAETAQKTVVLLECLSNLAANEQYLNGGTVKEISTRIMAGIYHLQEQAEDIIIVTNEVFSDGREYGQETVEYLQLLGLLNQQIGAAADLVTEVVYGIPLAICVDKGAFCGGRRKR